ncbi:telomere length regulation protein TEL2 homolog [Diadema setosum]|uniref:telomere length regulation protein TEL2 homolog n=1 Tax=Diadema setosum TaxID=31175 RepID=UPI003B3B8639
MEAIPRIKSTVHVLVSESKNVISSSKDGTEICRALTKVGALLPSSTRSDDEEGCASSTLPLDHLNLSADKLALARQQFCKHHYVQYLEYLCHELSLEWYGRFGRSQEGNDLFNRFFLTGIPQDALLVLCATLQSSSPSFKQKKCALLLEEFFKHHQLREMLIELCGVLPLPGSRDSKSVTLQTQWDQVMTLLVTLPDRMANKCKTECSAYFHPDQYIQMVAMEVLQTLHHVHNCLSGSTDCSLQFVSQLIGRLCLHGHTERLFDVLLPHLVKLSMSDYIWTRIANRLLAGAPDRSLEVILETLLKKLPWYGALSRLLGDAVLTKPKINFLLTNKFLLLRHYDADAVPQNLIGYLASSPTRRHLVVKVLKTVLDTWGDRSAVKHTSHAQHLYLTKIIIICVGHLSEEERKKNKGDLTSHLMGGVQAHLESPLPRTRHLGMVAAEIMAKTLDPDGPKLKFEFQEDEESRHLWSLVKPPEDPGLDGIAEDINGVTLKEGSDTPSARGNAVNGKSGPQQSPVTAEEDEELDSDDEFEPYDMTHDTKILKVKIPVYVRDCMDGLVARDNSELTEASLKVAEKLIRAKPDDLKNVCSQFVAILLHLEDQYSTENFRFLRHSAMVALTVNCPVEATEYLTREFYDRNYNIRQRMDILEVLAAAAQELSRPAEDPAPPPAKERRVELLEPMGGGGGDREGDAENWRNIVQRRIESKTRRFAKGPSKPAASPVVNRFAPVAGHFFFPLMKAYDRKLNTMDLLGNDFLLLGRLMYTLGVIMYAAQHAPVCRQMASSLLDVIWSLRYHTEQYVRQSLMFAVSMVTLSVPSHLLTTDFQGEIMECRCWLQDIVEKDPEPQCKALAAQTLLVIDSTIRKELDVNR